MPCVKKISFETLWFCSWKRWNFDKCEVCEIWCCMQSKRLAVFFCSDPLDNILWCNLMKIIAHPCWRLCVPVLFSISRSRKFWVNRWGVWRSWVVRYFGCKCVSVGMMSVSQRRCWNMLQQNSGNICCQCTMTSFVTAQCLDRGVNTRCWFSTSTISVFSIFCYSYSSFVQLLQGYLATTICREPVHPGGHSYEELWSVLHRESCYLLPRHCEQPPANISG